MIPGVAAGVEHSLFVDVEGHAWGCGSNRAGQLGLGYTSAQEKLVQIPLLTNIISVSCGSFSSFFIDSAGLVWACGNNTFGQMGITGDEQQTVISPTLLENLPPIRAVASSYKHTLFLDYDGFVWSCGDNETGVLGLGDKNNRLVPEKIKTLPQIHAVSVGPNHSLFLDVSGSVWSCGENDNGELGLCGGSYCASAVVPMQIQNLPKITVISAGYRDSLFLDESGTVWCCGLCSHLDPDGELTFRPKVIENIPPMSFVCSRCDFCLFIETNGNVWTCGFNYYGELGTSGSHFPSLVPYLSNILFGAAGDGHTLLLDENGGIHVCGNNHYGQLGLEEAQQNQIKIRRTATVLEDLPPIRTPNDEKRKLRLKSARNAMNDEVCVF